MRETERETTLGLLCWLPPPMHRTRITLPNNNNQKCRFLSTGSFKASSTRGRKEVFSLTLVWFIGGDFWGPDQNLWLQLMQFTQSQIKACRFYILFIFILNLWKGNIIFPPHPNIFNHSKAASDLTGKNANVTGTLTMMTQMHADCLVSSLLFSVLK